MRLSARRIVVMGVTGCGKTTVGMALADRLALPFSDGDQSHSPENLAKMSAGIALEDVDRLPWLEAVGAWLADHPDGGVIGCSALRRAYRDLLRAAAPDAWFLHLAGAPEVIRARVEARKGHFMSPTLVESQFALLQPLAADEAGLTVDLALPVEEIVDLAVAALTAP
ncbi:gluconokinase [Actinocorallia lasiicapitis]